MHFCCLSQPGLLWLELSISELVFDIAQSGATPDDWVFPGAPAISWPIISYASEIVEPFLHALRA
jgi:hypothetical protein